MPRHDNNTWLERISGYLRDMAGVKSGSADNNGGVIKVGGEVNTTTYTYINGSRVALQLDQNGNLKVTSATVLDEDIDAVTSYDKSYTYTRVTASGIISGAPIALAGFYIEASSSGVISLYDNASAASGSAMLALSKAVTTNDLILLEKPIIMTAGVYFSLVSGTATVSVLTRKITSQ